MYALTHTHGKSREYSKWAVNLWKGCSAGCKYCYLKRFPLSTEMGGNTPEPKKIFTTPEMLSRYGSFQKAMIAIAKKEILGHYEEIVRDGGLLFSFTTDPCLPITQDSTMIVASFCVEHGIPVMILTKQTLWLKEPTPAVQSAFVAFEKHKELIAFGFTITGHDELEPCSASNHDRISAMKELHEKGFHVWMSMEPVIDCATAQLFFSASLPYWEHAKIGLLTGGNSSPSPVELEFFISYIKISLNGTGKTVFLKRSVLKALKKEVRSDYIFVDENYSFLKHES